MTGGLARQDRFVVLPAALLQAGLSSQAIYTYAALATFADREGACWPSVKTLAEVVGCSKRTLQRALGELEKAGWLLVEGRVREDGSTTSNGYLLATRPFVSQSGTPPVSNRIPPLVSGLTPLELEPLELLKEPPLTPPQVAPVGSSESDDLFDAFWERYPRRVGKGAARRAWDKALAGGADPQVIVAAISANPPTATEARYLPHPSTWLNAQRWLDEQPQSAGQAAADLYAQAYEAGLTDADLLTMTDEQVRDAVSGARMPAERLSRGSGE